MNREELDKKYSAKTISGKVAATMSLVNATRNFESYNLSGNANSEHRYINASSQNSDYILFIIPATWGVGSHDLKAHSDVIRFEPSAGFPNDWSWAAKRGEIFITDIDPENFSGSFVCYENATEGEDKPGLLGGNFKINFNAT